MGVSSPGLNGDLSSSCTDGGKTIQCQAVTKKYFMLCFSKPVLSTAATIKVHGNSLIVGRTTQFPRHTVQVETSGIWAPVARLLLDTTQCTHGCFFRLWFSADFDILGTPGTHWSMQQHPSAFSGVLLNSCKQLI